MYDTSRACDSDERILIFGIKLSKIHLHGSGEITLQEISESYRILNSLVHNHVNNVKFPQTSNPPQ